MEEPSAPRPSWSPSSTRLRRLLGDLTLTQRLVLTGVLVGAAAGLSAYVFDRLIVLTAQQTLERAALWSPWLRVPALVLLPALGALAGALLIHHVCPEAKGHGVDEIMHAISESRGVISGHVAWVKSLASALTIGTGGSAGREGPVIQIGGAVGSFLGQRLRVSSADLKMLVAAGASSGLAASFGVPLAAVFFTMEVILRDFASEAFPAVVIASVTGAVTARMAMGGGGFMAPLSYHWHEPAELFFFSLLGLTCAPFGAIYMRVLARIESLAEAPSRWPRWLAPAAGGLAVGGIALGLPEVLGTGQETINLALRGQAHGWRTLALGFGKIAASSATLGSGGSGGAFMPALFIGSMMGSAWAGFLHRLGLGVEPGAYALVGMACVVTSAYRAPVTAIIMALEISRNYDILMPVMLACVIAALTTRTRESSPLIER